MKQKYYLALDAAERRLIKSVANRTCSCEQINNCLN